MAPISPHHESSRTGTGPSRTSPASKPVLPGNITSSSPQSARALMLRRSLLPAATEMSPRLRPRRHRVPLRSRAGRTWASPAAGPTRSQAQPRVRPSRSPPSRPGQPTRTTPSITGPPLTLSDAGRDGEAGGVPPPRPDSATAPSGCPATGRLSGWETCGESLGSSRAEYSNGGAASRGSASGFPRLRLVQGSRALRPHAARIAWMSRRWAIEGRCRRCNRRWLGSTGRETHLAADRSTEELDVAVPLARTRTISRARPSTGGAGGAALDSGGTERLSGGARAALQAPLAVGAEQAYLVVHDAAAAKEIARRRPPGGGRRPMRGRSTAGARFGPWPRIVINRAIN